MNRSRSTTYRTWLSKFVRKWYLKIFYRVHLRMGLKTSFAQSGEDLIALGIFASIGITKPSYLDIGAYHPYELSNTALFYLNGCRGINVEPNPDLILAFNRERPNDTNLNLGIADAKGELDYYVMSTPVLNTFSKESAEESAKEGYPIIAKNRVAVWTIADVVDTYCAGQHPDFLSLDIEGQELSVLNTIDYAKSSPVVICAETLSFSSNRLGVKNHEVINFLKDKGYFIYADTHLNTLFVKSEMYHAS